MPTPRLRGLRLLTLSTLLTGMLFAQPLRVSAQEEIPALNPPAQQPTRPDSGTRPPTTPASPPRRDVRVLEVRQKLVSLQMAEKSSRILQLDQNIRTVDDFDPTVLKVTQVNNDPRQIRITAVSTGATSMLLVDDSGDSFRVEVLVGGDTKHLEILIRDVFPDSSVKAVKVKEAVLLYGWVSQADQITTIVRMAEQFSESVLNYLRVSGDQQVMLHVKIMEVQRGKIRNLGFNFLEMSTNAYGASSIGGLAPLTALTVPFGGPPSATLNQANSSAAFGIVSNDNIFQGFIEALKQESLLKVLAEPNLVAINGRPANFLNGGEFPILVPQGLGTVAVQFKPFGVQLEFVSNNLGNGRVRLDVTPSVSEKDLSNTVTVGTTTIPALTVRRANTQVEMNIGETLVIAGLISNRVQSIVQKTPFLGELPLIGAAFRRIKHDESETELMIMVTPELAGPVTDGNVPLGPGSNTVSPTDRELFGSGYLETMKYAPDPEADLAGPDFPNTMGAGAQPIGYGPNAGAPVGDNRPPPVPESYFPPDQLVEELPPAPPRGAVPGQPEKPSNKPPSTPPMGSTDPMSTRRQTRGAAQVAARSRSAPSTLPIASQASSSRPLLSSPARKAIPTAPRPKLIEPVSHSVVEPAKPRSGRPSLITP